MKKVIFILIICCAIYSCVKNESKDVLDDLLVSYMAIMYNYGPSYTIDEIKTFAEQSSYDDDVLEYYHYFCGKIKLKDVKLHEKPQIYDQRIKDYIKQHLPMNNSNNYVFIDNFDDPPPVQILFKNTESENILSERLYSLLYRDWQNEGLFKSWYKSFYNDEVNIDQLKEYANLLAKSACSYSFTMRRLQNTSSTFYKDYVDLSEIPAELLLAIAYKESRFFPGSFRAEIYQDKIQAISMGLCHILVDADTLEIPDIGNQVVDMRTFELIGYYYLGNDYGKKNTFNEIDLLQIKGNFLVCAIQLGLIYQRLSEILKDL
ncbi:hypothetical protein [Thermotoga profunda]|uniref:hypothetical protein n=1 Tax=Thermotoga profunda TaxID=1508420 RepID=UPI000596C905|nr:hypothetical protein [Thermotoga profunda]